MFLDNSRNDPSRPGLAEAMAVDGNEHRGDQFRSSELNKRRIRKSPRNLLFLSRRGRTRQSIECSLTFIPTCCPGGSDARTCAISPRKLLTKTRRGQRFEPTRLPSFIEMSGLRLPRPRRYVQDGREVGRSRRPS